MTKRTLKTFLGSSYFYIAWDRFGRGWVSCGLALLLAFSLGVSERAVAQMGQKSNICGSWNNYCKGPTTSTPSNNSPPVYRTSPAELERRRKKTAATVANNKGVEYANQGQYGQAIREYEKVLKLDANNATARRNLQHAKAKKALHAGNVHFDNKDYVAAITYYRQGLGYWSKEDSNTTRILNKNIRAAESWIRSDQERQQAEVKKKAAEAQRQAAERERQQQLANAKRAITGILENLSTEFAASSTSIYSQNRSSDSLDFIGHDDPPSSEGNNTSSSQGLRFISVVEEEGKRAAKDTQLAILNKPKGGEVADAGSQLNSTRQTGGRAASAESIEQTKGQAELGFDTPGETAGSITYLQKEVGKNPWKAPLVTDEDRKRIPQILTIEQNRQVVRQKRGDLAAKLEKLRRVSASQRAKDWAVQEVLIKQEISVTEKKEQFYNYAIGDLLRKYKKQS